MQRAENAIPCRLVAGLQVTEHLPELGPGREAAEVLLLHAKRVQAQMHMLKKNMLCRKARHLCQDGKGFICFSTLEVW